MVHINPIGVPHASLSRRDFIRAGTLGAASLLLPRQLFASVEGINLNANYKLTKVGNTQYPMVVIWLEGGMSHIDTFCSLPGAPEQFRGPFGHTQSSVPGLPISEKLPLMARQMHNVALLRNIHHTQGDHRLATNRMFTGSDMAESSGKPRYQPYIVKLGKHLGSDNLGYVIFNAAGNIYESLGPSESLLISYTYDQENKSQEYRSPFGAHFDKSRHRARRKLLDQMNSSTVSEKSFKRWEELSDRANQILDGNINDAFDLNSVPAFEMERYGRNSFGDAAIIAKRMIAAGAPLILLQRGGWDNHSYLVEQMSNSLPQLDKVLSALIEDLKDKAIVVVASEFGRTPKMNEGQDDKTGQKSPPGRDHWPQSNFMIVAGPNITPRVIGKLDNTGTIIGNDGQYDAALMGPTILRACGYELREDRSGALSADSLPYYPIF